MKNTFDKDRLIEFIYDTFELAATTDVNGYPGEALGIQIALTRLAADFGISQAVTDVARDMAFEKAEGRQVSLAELAAKGATQ